MDSERFSTRGPGLGAGVKWLGRLGDVLYEPFMEYGSVVRFSPFKSLVALLGVVMTTRQECMQECRVLFPSTVHSGDQKHDGAGTIHQGTAIPMACTVHTTHTRAPPMHALHPWHAHHFPFVSKNSKG